MLEHFRMWFLFGKFIQPVGNNFGDVWVITEESESPVSHGGMWAVE